MKLSHGMSAVAGALAAGLLGVVLAPRDAHACGGCFGPVGQPTVVTAHRMAVSLSTSGTTLWDQIQYAGTPADFVWVLPIKGTMAVELADNAFFEALEQATQITMQGTFPPLPPTTCPDPCAPAGLAGSGCAGPGTICIDRDAGVSVFHEGAVGPYETATIGSTDPTALVTWLRDHGYAIPDSVVPTIQYYVDSGFNFAALRLSPNAGVQQMQPVRVTTPGLGLTFPLRMVGAGVSESVALELFVFGEGRYEASNFPTVELDHTAISYDWASGTFNYDALFARALEANGGRAWIAETAFDAPASISYYTSYDTSDGTMHAARPDWDVATRYLGPAPYLTKLRTDLAARFLDQDILLSASSGRNIPNLIRVSRETNRPPPPPPCPTVCTHPGSTVASGWPASTSFRVAGRGDGLCTVTPGHETPSLALGALVAAALALFVARRRRG